MTSNLHHRSNKQADHLLAHYSKIGSPAILAAVRHISARKASHIENNHYNKKALAFVLSRNG
ncbi:hypothetical protein ACI0FM_04415 [Paenochrobactrum sp. BZR 588]|uniref:hypothetical protein n=1 Tax=Paenochrobactrum TaxID=999488 RepID=UPI0035BBEA2D